MKTQPCDTILDLQKDTAALKQLEDLEELVDVPPERGGVHFSDWERGFIKSVLFTEAAREDQGSLASG